VPAGELQLGGSGGLAPVLLRQGSAASLEGRARRPVQRALHRRPRRAVRSKLPALGVQCVQRGPAAAPASLSNGRCAPHCEWSRESLLRGCAGGSGKRGVWVEGGGTSVFTRGRWPSWAGHPHRRILLPALLCGAAGRSPHVVLRDDLHPQRDIVGRGLARRAHGPVAANNTRCQPQPLVWPRSNSTGICLCGTWSCPTHTVLPWRE
jgi:hypothetical protein